MTHPNPEPDALIGLTVGNYKITSKLGVGGMGAVYLALHPSIGRKVAVKVLLPEHSQRQDLITRFFNEAKATATLRHPALVDVLDFGFLPDGAGYLVMDFLEGESLAARLRRVAPLHPEVAAEIGRQLCAGISAAHAQGIVHRDLKPDNIFLEPDPELPSGERVKILDFGIAKLSEPGTKGSKGATSTGMLIGTPLYMAPEQCRGAGLVDHRADIYSVGCILYEMLSGKPPFAYEGVGEILAAHLHQEPQSLAAVDPTLPPNLTAVVMRALAKDPAARPQTMAELGADLQCWLREAGVEGAFPHSFSASHPIQAGRSSGGRVLPSGARPMASGARPLPAPSNGTGAGGAAPAEPVNRSAIATAPTTFSAAASHAAPRREIPSPPARSPMPFLIGALAAVGVAAGAGFLFMRTRVRPDPPVPANTTAEAPQPAPAAAAPSEAAPPPIPTPTPGATAAPASPPATVTTATEAPTAAASPPASPPSDPPAAPTAEAKPAAAAPEPPARPEPKRPDRPAAPAPASRAHAHFEEGINHRAAGDEAKALRAFQAALRGQLSPDERREAEQHTIALRRKFGEIDFLGGIRGALISVDGRPEGRTPLPHPILALPGKHTVVIELPGYEARRQVVDVEAGRTRFISLKADR